MTTLLFLIVVGLAHASSTAVAPDYADAKASFEHDGKPWPQHNRQPGTIDRIVIHSTFDKDATRDVWFNAERIFDVWWTIVNENGKPTLSTHYLIARDGTVYQLVAEAKAAHHAGAFNSRSIGIEMAGVADNFVKGAKAKGATEADLAYTDEQYEALNKLVADIVTRHASAKLIRHSEIYGQEKQPDGTIKWVQRRWDPGAKFDAARVKGPSWVTSHQGE